jgi:hypothetical protein
MCKAVSRLVMAGVVMAVLPTPGSAQRIIGADTSRLFAIPGIEVRNRELLWQDRAAAELPDVRRQVMRGLAQSRGAANGWRTVGVGLVLASTVFLTGALMENFHALPFVGTNDPNYWPWVGLGVAFGAGYVGVNCAVHGCYWERWWR